MINAYTVTGKDGDWTITSNIGTNDLLLGHSEMGGLFLRFYEEAYVPFILRSRNDIIFLHRRSFAVV